MIALCAAAVEICMAFSSKLHATVGIVLVHVCHHSVIPRIGCDASLAVIQAAAHLVMVYVSGLVPDIIPGQAAASGVGIGLHVKACVNVKGSEDFCMLSVGIVYILR